MGLSPSCRGRLRLTRPSPCPLLWRSSPSRVDLRVDIVSMGTRPTICSGAAGHTVTVAVHGDSIMGWFWAMKLGEVFAEF
jgi:hypothetical protein